jgi:hypothetical protein
MTMGAKRSWGKNTRQQHRHSDTNLLPQGAQGSQGNPQTAAEIVTPTQIYDHRAGETRNCSSNRCSCLDLLPQRARGSQGKPATTAAIAIPTQIYYHRGHRGHRGNPTWGQLRFPMDVIYYSVTLCPLWSNDRYFSTTPALNYFEKYLASVEIYRNLYFAN